MEGHPPTSVYSQTTAELFHSSYKRHFLSCHSSAQNPPISLQLKPKFFQYPLLLSAGYFSGLVSYYSPYFLFSSYWGPPLIWKLHEGREFVRSLLCPSASRVPDA